MKRNYTISDAARATGTTVSALKKWLQRNVINEIGEQKDGCWTRFNKRDIAVLELTRVLYDHGFTVKRACQIAYNFVGTKDYKDVMQHDLFMVAGRDENTGAYEYVIDRWQLHERIDNAVIVLRPKRIINAAWSKL